jgi:hypothetical protein
MGVHIFFWCFLVFGVKQHQKVFAGPGDIEAEQNFAAARMERFLDGRHVADPCEERTLEPQGAQVVLGCWACAWGTGGRGGG